MSRPANLLSLLLAATSLCLAAADPVSAVERFSRKASITVCGTFGNAACYTAPVRRTAGGAEFRLKSGRWVDCAGDCRDRLRQETVDFWDEQRNSSGH